MYSISRQSRYPSVAYIVIGFLYLFLQFVDNDNRIRRNTVKFGICIPDSCTATDLEISLQNQFDKHFLPHRVKALVRVQSILCSTDKDEYPYDAGFYLTRWSCFLKIFMYLYIPIYNTINKIIIHIKVFNDWNKTEMAWKNLLNHIFIQYLGFQFLIRVNFSIFAFNKVLFIIVFYCTPCR